MTDIHVTINGHELDKTIAEEVRKAVEAVVNAPIRPGPMTLEEASKIAENTHGYTTEAVERALKRLHRHIGSQESIIRDQQTKLDAAKDPIQEQLDALRSRIKKVERELENSFTTPYKRCR